MLRIIGVMDKKSVISIITKAAVGLVKGFLTNYQLMRILSIDSGCIKGGD